MLKLVLIYVIIFVCIGISFCEGTKDEWSTSSFANLGEKDPGGNRYIGQTITMHENSKFQIRKSMYTIEENKMLIIVEIEKLGKDDHIDKTSIQEYLDNKVKILNNSNCYSLNNSSMMAKLKNKLINKYKISDSDYTNKYEIKLLQNNSSLEAFIPRIKGEVTLIYSFEICPAGNSNSNNNNKIEFFAMTVVDPIEYPSSSLNAKLEIEPLISFDITATPDLYEVNTGDLHCINYQIRYFSSLEAEKDISIEFEEGSGGVIKKIICENKTILGTELKNQSINTSNTLKIALFCEYPIESVYPIPTLTIKNNNNEILQRKTFDDINIIVKDEYPIELILSIIALMISAITGCFSAIELFGSNKVIKSNNKAMTYQTQKMTDINIALAELKKEIKDTNYNLDRIRRRMPK